MIENLRRRFIVLAMASLLLVLAVTLGAVNALNYRGVLSDADAVLTLLAENDGRFPPPDEGRDAPGPPHRSFSPEMPYESRFFSVLLDAAGRVRSSDLGRIAAIGADAAADYAASVWQSGRTRGFAAQYRFLRTETEAGSRIIFLDCGRSLDTFRRFLLAGCGIALLVSLAVLGLVTALSGRVIRPLAEAQQKQKQFITDAGHELRTPLTIINADAEILKMEQGESEWLQEIQTQTARLAALTDELVSLSRLEEGGARLQRAEVPFSELAEQALAAFQAIARVQHKTLQGDVTPLLSLTGDEKALRQLLHVLLDNALKYAPSGGVITLRLERQGRSLHLSVHNPTAAPVGRDTLAHLFDRFYRADPSRGAEGGYGIGLSIARAAVQAHRGRIAAETPDGRSLRITVTLPQ